LARKVYEQEKRAHKTPEYRKANAARKRARYHAEKKGLVKKGDNRELDHKQFRKGTGPYKVVSKTANRKRQPATRKRGQDRDKYTKGSK
jgi:hypothetical protein